MAETATVLVDGQYFTGRVYHTRDNGWPCVETPSGHIASGPRVESFVMPAHTHCGVPIQAFKD